MSFRVREWLRRVYCTITRQYNDSDEELRFHLAMAEEEAGRRGETQRDARIRVGGIAQSAEAVCDQRSIGWLADLLRDSRHGFRLLRKTQGSLSLRSFAWRWASEASPPFSAFSTRFSSVRFRTPTLAAWS